jgi:hypothetical protein
MDKRVLKYCEDIFANEKASHGNSSSRQQKGAVNIGTLKSSCKVIALVLIWKCTCAVSKVYGVGAP